jgi:hypothetical protein
MPRATHAPLHPPTPLSHLSTLCGVTLCVMYSCPSCTNGIQFFSFTGAPLLAAASSR